MYSKTDEVNSQKLILPSPQEDENVPATSSPSLVKDVDESYLLQQKDGDIQCSLSGADISALFHRIPPEVWERVFEYLPNFCDCVNASQAIAYWRQILDSTKSSWMFGLALPSFLEYLSKEEILDCRLVSKHWCSGIDHFLQNNTFHTPTLEDLRYPSKSLFTYHLSETLRKLKLDYNNFEKQEKIEKFVWEAATHSPRCPLVGRSAKIVEIHQNLFTTLNYPFLQLFGHHIKFMQITTGRFTALQNLVLILDFTEKLPGLKKLEVVARVAITDGVTEAQVDNELSEFMTRRLACRETGWFPKVETLQLAVTGYHCERVEELLFNYFCNKNLRSLRIDELPIPPNCSDFLENLADLSVTISSNLQLTNLLQLGSPVKKLVFLVRHRIQLSILFQVVAQFHSSLNYLELHIFDEFFVGSAQPCVNLSEQMQRLMEPEILKGNRNLNQINIISYYPISFNFLCGLAKSLEYLRISVSAKRQTENETVTPQRNNDEILDLQQILTTAGKIKIYGSNVWAILPKLKTLTIHVGDISHNYNEKKYRRDIYEKLERIRNRDNV